MSRLIAIALLATMAAVALLADHRGYRAGYAAGVAADSDAFIRGHEVGLRLGLSFCGEDTTKPIPVSR
jgi:hypothetical protein